MQKELYLRILEQFPNPIWRSGLDAKCDYFNKAWLDFTGRTIKQEMGDGWTKGVHPDEFDFCVKTYMDAFGKRKSFKMEYRLMHNDGTYHWLSDFGSPFYDDDGNFAGYIGSCYDINLAKNHVDEVEKMNKFMIDRESKMIELKKKLAEFKKNKT